mgnify:FL=1
MCCAVLSCDCSEDAANQALSVVLYDLNSSLDSNADDILQPQQQGSSTHDTHEAVGDICHDIHGMLVCSFVCFVCVRFLVSWFVVFLVCLLVCLLVWLLLLSLLCLHGCGYHASRLVATDNMMTLAELCNTRLDQYLGTSNSRLHI